jgi:potassium channel subfamily K
MTIGATGISICSNVMLISDFYLVPDFSKSGSGLTRKQRSVSLTVLTTARLTIVRQLLIAVMILLGWIAFGAIIYSSLMKLTYIDGLYCESAGT